VTTWSNPGDLVYDCFMGSGTTAKAAHQLGRNWIGSEISSEYVDLANKRLEPYLAQHDLFK
jgi:DNA modification methylase